MKYLLFIFALLFYIHLSGQKIYTTKSDISEIKEIIFYGYDFSNFKLAEAKRLNDGKLSVYVPAWVGFLNKSKDEKYYTKSLKTDKVVFDFEYTTEIMKNLKDDDIVTITKNIISPDSIQNIINKYQIKQKEGIGFVIIVECFEKLNRKSTGYFTFFDIATKKVIMCNYYGTSHAEGQGLTKFWGIGLGKTIYYYFDEVYKKQLRSK